MPLNPRASVGTDIKEFRTGKTYRHTEDEEGKAAADRQALAVALHTKDKAEEGDHHVADLTPAKRKEMPSRDFGQPSKKGFPMTDPTHDRLAISGATRSYNAGNISKSEEEKLKGEARRKLGDGNEKKDPPEHHAEDHKAAVAKMHPEHVHRLVQDAHDGKYGPEAQTAAKAAMQQPSQEDTDQDGDSAQPNYADMYSANGPAEDEDQQGPETASSIFAGSRGR